MSCGVTAKFRVAEITAYCPADQRWWTTRICCYCFLAVAHARKITQPSEPDGGAAACKSRRSGFDSRRVLSSPPLSFPSRGSPASAEDEQVAVEDDYCELLTYVHHRHNRPEFGHVRPGLLPEATDVVDPSVLGI